MNSRVHALEHELKIAENLAREAGKILLRYLAGQFEIKHKEHGEVVTQADQDVDTLIRSGLQAAFPEDALYSEETADSPHRLSASRVWIVDPIDGTSNFIARGDEFCISIGLSINGQAVLGIVYNPGRDELFAGARGHGVTLNGRPVRVSDAADLSGSRILVSRKELQGGLDSEAFSAPLIPLASMAYKLARVSAGLEDGVFSLKKRKEWGTCAGVALIENAGGRATLIDGGDIRFNRQRLKQPLGMVAAGRRLYPILCEALKMYHQLNRGEVRL